MLCWRTVFQKITSSSTALDWNAWREVDYKSGVMTPLALIPLIGVHFWNAWGARCNPPPLLYYCHVISVGSFAINYCTVSHNVPCLKAGTCKNVLLNPICAKTLFCILLKDILKLEFARVSTCCIKPPSFQSTLVRLPRSSIVNTTLIWISFWPMNGSNITGYRSTTCEKEIDVISSFLQVLELIRSS